MNSERTRDGFAEPLFFAVLEIASFAFLFLSPYFGGALVATAWGGLVLWRVAALAGLLAYPVTGGKSIGQRLWLCSRAALYSIPFWTSSLLFPLRPDQSPQIARALWAYVILTVVACLLSFFPTRWFPGFLAGVTFLWVQAPELSGATWWTILLPLALLAWPRGRGSASLEPGWVRGLCLLGTAGWSFSIFFYKAGAAAGLQGLSLAMLHWLLLVGASVELLSQAEFERRTRAFLREGELGMPTLRAGLTWRYARLLVGSWGVWFCALETGLGWEFRGVERWTPAAAVLLAMPGLWSLAARGVREGNLQWWSCGQFVILWGLAETPSEFASMWILLGIFLSAYYHFSPELTPVYAGEMDDGGARRLESLLEGALAQKAPPGLAGSILGQLEPSVDIDESLTSSAPRGFSQRLLERLRRQDDGED